MRSHTFFCIDAHTCGNPVRVVAGGGPFLEGRTMSEKRQHFLAEFDWIRTGLMFEPRGHDMMSGSIPYPSTRDDCDVAILFIETSGCLPMCGHGTIGTVTVLIERGLVTPQTPGLLRLETPAGRVDAHYQQNESGKVTSVRIVNVPSFLHSAHLTVDCPDLGELSIDVAYGGNFYAIVEPQGNYRGIDALGAGKILQYSPIIRKRMNEKYTFVHPDDPTICGLSHLEWSDKPKHPEAHARNAVFYGDKAIDRSPCGTGTSARMAQKFIVIFVATNVGVGLRPTPTGPAPTTSRKQHGLPEIVRALKSFSSRRINQLRETTGTPFWQRLHGDCPEHRRLGENYRSQHHFYR